MKEDGLELLKLANRFDYAQLKLQLEADLIEADIIGVENAAEILLLADSHCCAMLKEAAMHIVADHYPEVSKTEGGKDLKETASLLHEVLEMVSKK